MQFLKKTILVIFISYPIFINANTDINNQDHKEVEPDKTLDCPYSCSMEMKELPECLLSTKEFKDKEEAKSCAKIREQYAMDRRKFVDCIASAAKKDLLNSQKKYRCRSKNVNCESVPKK